MRAAGHQFAGNPFQIAARLFELDAWGVAWDPVRIAGFLVLSEIV